MRILFLTQWFQPEPFFKGLPFAKRLQAMGHDVEVLTGFPNYPGGELYSGYKLHFFQREKMNGVSVNRVALFPSHDRSTIRRIINYISFSVSATLLGPFLVKKPDIIYVYNLITLAWAAVILKNLYGCKVVYDVQDLWPESVANSGMLNNRSAMSILNWWCRWAYRQADKIAVLSPGFKKALVSQGIAEKHIEIIYNWEDETSDTLPEIDKHFIEKWGICKPFNVVFAGTMGFFQRVDTVLETAYLLKKILPNLGFILVGGGVEVERLKSIAKKQKLDNVVFVDRQPKNTMWKIWSIADVLLVHLIDIPLFKITIPSKTQAYLAAGIPIVMAVRGDAANLVEQSRGGIVCPPEDPNEMAKAIIKLYEMTFEERKNIGHKGKEFYQRRLSFDNGCEKFIKLFREVTYSRRCV